MNDAGGSTANMNKILASLPATSGRWLEKLERVRLETGAVLYEPNSNIEYGYFLNDALVSIISMNSEGATVEIGLIGHEGMVGVPAILGGVTPYRAVVQMAGDAFRIRGQALDKEFQCDPHLRRLLLKYANAFLIQIAQLSICNCYHSLQERLCRWLLVARSAARRDLLLLTHDGIARLLGARRAGITVAAGLLQRAGLIKASRGQITILDPAGLQAISCECYGVLREGLHRLQLS